MWKAALGAVVGAALVAVAVFSIVPATASTGPKVAPVPYQARHAWNDLFQSALPQGTPVAINIPAGDRVIVLNTHCFCTINGTLNGQPVNESPVTQASNLNLALDSGTVTYNGSESEGSGELWGYVVPLS